MRRIILSKQAERDLHRAWEYIALDNISAADRLIAEIREAIGRIALMPGMGHWRADVPRSKCKFWTVRPYLIAYRYTKKTLTIIRIVHGNRDFRRIL